MVADLPDPLEIARWRRDGAARVLHRFEKHCGDGVGSFELDRLSDAVGRPLPERLDVGPEQLRRPVEIRVRHPEPAGGERLERRLISRQPGDRERALGGPVIGDSP